MTDTTIDISRDDDFRAFWANAYAEFGYAYTRVDMVAGLEGQIQMAAAFSTSGAGLQVESSVGALCFVADAGSSFRFDATKCSFETAHVVADCDAAHAALQSVEAEVVSLDSKLNSLESTVDYLEGGGLWLNGMAMMARM